MKFGVVVFPGSNCDQDMVYVLQEVLHQEVVIIWHKDTKLNNFSSRDCIILPGGFAFGDYLRAGAIARFSPIMPAIIDFANAGGNVLGICNGFQILCEAKLLPGALLRNNHQKFNCSYVYLKAERKESLLTSAIPENKVMKIPMAHAEGRFYADAKTIQQLESEDRVLFRYVDQEGNATPGSNPNGSVNNIAGICNSNGNVVGLMPHPERASEEDLGNTDGKVILESLLSPVSDHVK